MNTTPTGVTITAAAADGSTRNITEGVQVLYDQVIQSMDWGSGFLTVEDVRPIVDLARFCGFTDFEEAESYMEKKLLKLKQKACEHQSWTRLEYGRICDECGCVRGPAS